VISETRILAAEKTSRMPEGETRIKKCRVLKSIEVYSFCHVIGKTEPSD